MRRKIIILSVFAAAFAGAGFAECGLWLPTLGCIGWELLVLYASTRKKPRAATRSVGDRTETKILTYESKRKSENSQVRKIWTPDGNALTVFHFKE